MNRLSRFADAGTEASVTVVEAFVPLGQAGKYSAEFLANRMKRVRDVGKIRDAAEVTIRCDESAFDIEKRRYALEQDKAAWAAAKE